jgi:signal transduction histidine kinase
MTTLLHRSTVRIVRVRMSRLRLSPERLDQVVAASLFVVGQAEIWLTGDAGGFRVVAALMSPILAACVAFRRRWPLAAGIVAQGTMALTFSFWQDTQVIATSILWFCALYGLTVWTTTKRFAVGAAFVTASNLATLGGRFAKPTSTVPFTVVTLVVMLLVRWVLGDRERRLQLAERERDLAAREAVVDERARIARELHDAIAHNVSMMVVQAGGERRLLDGAGSSTHETLRTIEEVGRGALTEMRRLVGMLRSDSDDPLAPQAGLDDLPALVERVREAGLPVDLQVEGEARELPVGLELSAYRIVQEALTNALKHAGDARACVRVRYGADSLELEIVDDGAGAAPAVAGGGHGLVGMRERVALYGGRFDAGRHPGGGFAVRVLLPVR